MAVAEKLNNVVANPQSGVYSAKEEHISVELSSVDGLGNNDWVSAFGEISENYSSTPDLYFKNNETPYIAYSDAENNNKITVKKYNGSSLELIGERGFSNEPGLYPYIYFVDDIIHVMFRGTDTYNLKVMKYNGNIWEEDSIVANNSSFPVKLFIDNETPYIAYPDAENNNKITVKKYNGSSWETVGTAGLGTEEATNQKSLYVYNGVPYVAYQDRGNKKKTTVKKYNGSSWETVGTAGFSAGEANYQSLYVYNGVPYVAYQDRGNGSKTTVMKYNGSNWELVGVAGFSNAGVAAKNPSLLVHNGTPYVVYTENQSLILKKYNGSSWELVGDVFPASVSQSKLIINNNTLYFPFKDGYLFKATIIKHAIPINAKINYLQCEPGFPEGLEPMVEYTEAITLDLGETEIQTKVVSNDIAYLDSDIVKYRYYITDKTIIELDYTEDLPEELYLSQFTSVLKQYISFYSGVYVVDDSNVNVVIENDTETTKKVIFYVAYEEGENAYSGYFEKIINIKEVINTMANFNNLGLAEISYKKSGASAFTVLGMKKEGTAIEAAYEEMFEPVLTHEGGADTPFEEVISGQKFGFNLTVIDYTEQNLKDLTQVVDGTAGYEVGNNIGSLAPKYQVIIHFINDGADTSNDIYIPKCSLRIVNNINDTVNTPNELVIEAKAHWDDSVTPNILYKIGQNPA